LNLRPSGYAVGGDSRDAKALKHAARDIYIPDLHIDTLNVKARNFR
jgi:error-prone DNA polymerase